MTVNRLLIRIISCFGLPCLSLLLLSNETRAGDLAVHPESFRLSGDQQPLQLIATSSEDGGLRDVTRTASYRVLDSNVVAVNSEGHVVPVGNGTTVIEVTSSGQTRRVSITVDGQEAPEPISFRHHVLPVLARSGCSGGACHGSPNGKAGFRLSLFGLDAEFDRSSLVRDVRGRRINLVNPEESLLLRKPTMKVPHAGGRRLVEGGPMYRILRDWIGQGGRSDSGDVHCTGIKVFPDETRLLRFPASTQQFSVHASFSDGSVRDVTHLAQFSLSDVDVAEVTPGGLVTGMKRGETAVIIRYLEFISTPLLTFVRDVDGFEWNAQPASNYVDTHVDRKLRQLQYLPSEVCTDAEFVRRVYLDVIGLLPTPEEARRFFDDQAANKRSRLIDDLLERPEFARFQAQKWGDLLRVSRKQIGLTSVFKYSRWLNGAMSTNMPYDQFARELVTASGSTMTHPAGNYYRTAADTLDAMETTAQLFLGTRIQCAKCHNHPFERWTQNDYYGLAAFFNRLERRKTALPEEVLLTASSSGEIQHPATQRVMPPSVPADGSIAVDAFEDRRHVFARWLTSTGNPYFAKVEVNRIWSWLMGRGIVEPFDDFRDSNPPSNASLLDALAADFVAHRYDRTHVVRTILNSRTYQASSRSNESNRDDERYFSHYQPRRLTAEQLVDALGTVTGQRERFDLVAPTMRATWLPAPDLKPHDRAKLGDVEFLKVFGQPERQSVCSCDRGQESSLGQALELLNGGFLHRMLEHSDNRIHAAVRSNRSVQDVVRDLYLRALSREPTDRELQASLSYVASHSDAALALEDVCWAILNKDEFLFQH